MHMHVILYVVIALISNLIFRPFLFFSPFTVVQSNQIFAVFHTKKQKRAKGKIIRLQIIRLQYFLL